MVFGHWKILIIHCEFCRGGLYVVQLLQTSELSSLQKKVGAEMPEHEFTTGRAEKGELAVGALHSDRVLHDAIRIGAMSEAECMAQFVDGLFFQATYERRAANCGIAVGIAAQTITGDNGTRAFELGLAKYKGEDGVEEVDMGHAQDL